MSTHLAPGAPAHFVLAGAACTDGAVFGRFEPLQKRKECDSLGCIDALGAFPPFFERFGPQQ